MYRAMPQATTTETKNWTLGFLCWTFFATQISLLNSFWQLLTQTSHVIALVLRIYLFFSFCHRPILLLLSFGFAHKYEIQTHTSACYEKWSWYTNKFIVLNSLNLHNKWNEYLFSITIFMLLFLFCAPCFYFGLPCSLWVRVYVGGWMDGRELDKYLLSK